MSTECTLSLISPLDLASSSPFFDLTEFESFGSSLYTQFNANPQAWTAAEIPASSIPAPSPLSFDDPLVNVHEEVEAMPNKDSAQSPHTSLMQLGSSAPPSSFHRTLSNAISVILRSFYVFLSFPSVYR
ncbi:hypothetical protein EDB87DRAFT_1688135 [Lactarius vividus]|nr:hypothetical protein EDB87DRAFT_1688135 [Lactarius vividus]